jgi:DNA polymerase I-like protein with 3'-5' exonuclease and polymerase domains
LIQAYGKSGAEILLVEDSASNEDMLSGYALSGTAERTLRHFLSLHKYDLNQTWRTLLYKERLNYNGKNKKKFKEAIDQTNPESTNILFDEIISIRPNIIVPLGELSFNCLTGTKSINKYRGSILPLRPDIQSKINDRAVKVIPALGPRLLNENYPARVYTKVDLGKAVKYAGNTEFINPDGRIWVARTGNEFQNYLNRQKWENNYVVFDIETTYGMPTCISFSFDDSESVCVPLLDDSIDRANQINLHQLVNQVLKSKIGKVNQNIKYDATILERFGFNVKNISGDTVLRSGLIYPELPKNLGFLTSIYTEMPYHKDEGKDFDSNNRTKLYLYCAKDSLATRRIYDQQELELEEQGLQCLYKERIMPLFFIYKEMDGAGILVDDLARQKLRLKYEFLLNLNTNTLMKITERDFNPRSPKQCGQLIYEELRYPARKKDDNYKTDEDTLEELLILADCKFKEGPEILRLIIVCRKIAKLLEYINTPLHLDNRLRGSFNLAGTETGRTNCGKSLDRLLLLDDKGNYELETVGRSLQTITKHGFRIGNDIFGSDLRSMFVPTPGFIFVEADLSQAEARVDAVLAKDWSLLEQFDKPPGVHKLTAGWLYDKNPEEIKKGSLEYHVGKIARHAAERNIGAKHLSISCHLSLEKSTEILTKFHNKNPNIRGTFHQEVKDFLSRNGFLRCPNGRRRDFFGRPGDIGTINEAISYIPQAVVSDQNKFSFIGIKEEMPSVRYLMESHDSSLVEIKKDDLDAYSRLVNRHLVTDIDFRNCSISREYDLRIPCEIEWSDTNWQEMRKL